MKKLLRKSGVFAIALLIASLFLSIKSLSQSQTFNTPGTFTFTVPAGVTSITVATWGGGGAGGGVDGLTKAGGGGEGGSFVRGTISVLPGETYTVVVGTGGTGVIAANGGSGQASSFSVSGGGATLFNAIGGVFGAVGNNFGAGGNAANIGNIVSGSSTSDFYGGNGGTATNASSASSGGGGGSAGAGGNGGNGGTPLTAGAAGAGSGTPANPGVAGAAGRGSANDGNGNDAASPGGGGSGGRNANNGTDFRGGHGGNGQVIVSWPLPAGSCAGNAVAVLSQTGVTDPNNALGPQNDTEAQLYDTNDQLALDLINTGNHLSAGGSVEVRWRRASGTDNNPQAFVELSSNGITWTPVTTYTITTTEPSWAVQSIPLSVPTRYIRFTNLTTFNLDIDFLSYATPCAPPCTPPTISTSGTVAPVCFSTSSQTTSLAYSATAGDPISYRIDWTGMADQPTTAHTFLPGGGTITDIVIPASVAAGTYNGTLVITDGTGCQGTQAISVIVNPAPQVTSFASSTGNTSICTGDIGQLTMTITGTGPYTVVYNNGVSDITETGVVSGTPFNATPNPTSGTTTYTLVSVTGANGCPRTSGFTDGSAQISVRQLPTATIIGSTTVCQNSPSPNITFTGTAPGGTVPPYTFTYTVNGGTNQTISSTGSNSSVNLAVPTATAGTFTYDLVSVAYASTPNCTNPATGSAVITVDPAATANAGPNQTICAGGTITLAGSIGGSATSSTWSAPSGGFGNVSSLNSTYTPSITSGSVILTLTTDDPAGPCPAATSTMTVTITPLLVTTGVTICQDGSGSLTATNTCPVGGTFTSGPNFSGTGANVTGIGNTAWTNTGNIVSDNNSYATVTLPNASAVSNYLQGTNHAFAIPATATINGIQVTISRFSTNVIGLVRLRDNQVRLVKSGTVVGLNRANTGDWPSSEAPITYGTPSDLWGTTWSPAEINDPNFGAALSVLNATGASQSYTGSVDYIRITVTYTMPAVAVNWYTAPTGGSPIGTGSPFNPVGVTGSGLPNTSTPGITTFYAACSNTPDCRTATNFEILAKPTADADVDVTTICQGQTVTVFATVSGDGTSPILWTTSGTGTFGDDNALSTVYTPGLNETGNTTLTLTTNDPPGPCGPATDFVVITINAAATANAGGDQTICAGDPVNVTGTRGGFDVTSSTWTTSGDGSFNGTQNSLAATYTPGAADITAGTVTLTLTTNDPSGPCDADSDDMVVTINPTPAIPTITGTSGPICPNTFLDGEFSADDVAGLTYLWTIAGNFSATSDLTEIPLSVVAGPDNAPFTLTLTVTNEFGCSATSAVKTVIVEDNNAPVLTGTLPGGDAGDVCMANAPAAPATAVIEAEYTDDCGAVTATLINSAVTGTNCSWTATYTYSVTDASGNAAANAVVVYTGSDETAPTLTGTPYAGTTGTNACMDDAATAAPFSASNATQGYTDNCGAAVTAILTNTVVTGGDCGWTVTYTFTIEDECGNALPGQTYSNTGSDQTAPTGTAPAGTTGINACYIDDLTPPLGTPAFDPIAAAAGYSDNCGDPVTATLTGTAVTGNSCSWTVTYTFSVSDLCGNILADQTIIHSGSDQTAPTLTGIPYAGTTGINACMADAVTAAPFSAALAITGYSDNCGAAVTATLTGTDVTGTNCSWIVTYTFTVEDECGNDLTGQTYSNTGSDQTDPVLSSQPADVTVSCDAVPVVPAITATDNCAGSVVVIFSSSNTQGTDPASCDYYNYTITRTWTATDGCNNNISHTQTITVHDVTAPIVTAGTIAGCYQTIGAAVNAAVAATTYSDNCATNLTPATATTPVVSCSTVITITYMDPCGNSNFVTYNVKIDNTAPVAPAAPAAANYQCVSQVPAPGPLTATETCSGPITVTGVDQNNGGSGCVGDPLIITRTWTFTNPCGLSSAVSQTITVIDDIDPTITSCPPNVTVSCAASTVPASTGSATATDNCGIPDVTHSDVNSPVVGGSYTITRTWTATDGCGNTSSCIQTITVEDNVPPTITCPDPITRNTDPGMCGASVSFVLSSSENCGTATITSDYESGDFFPIGTTTVTATATDPAGNIATCSFTVTVNDNQAPAITCPANITQSNDAGVCGAVVTYIAPVGTDNCAGSTTALTAGLASGSTFPVGTTTNTFTVTDASGNPTSCSFTVTVNDNQAPAITCPANITVSNTAGQCGAIVNYPVATATDNCSVESIVYSKASGSFFPVGATIVTATAEDVAGNTAACQFTITVNDTEAPVPSLVSLPTITGTCTVTLTRPTATDNCMIGSINGTKTGSLTFSAVGTYNFDWTYTDNNGNSSTQPQTVIVLGSPVVINTHPVSVAKCVGQTATFSVVATGEKQWQVNTGSSWTTLVGQTNSSLTLANVTIGMNGNQYRVIVTGLCGSVTSNAATLTVNALPTVFNVTGGGSFCSGAGVGIGLASSQLGVSYQLFRSVTIAMGGLVNGTGGAISFGNQNQSGVYTVVATRISTGCKNNMGGSVTVASGVLPNLFNVTGGGAFCPGGTGPLVGLSGSQSGASYQLFRNGSALGSPRNGNGSPINFGSQTLAGTYTVVATYTGCTRTMTGSAIVTAGVVPLLKGVTGGGAFCTGGTGPLVGLSNSQTGVRYQLFRSGSIEVGSPVNGNGSPINFGNQNILGTYTVVATHILSGCTRNMAGNAVVSAGVLPSIFTVTGGGVACAGTVGPVVGLSGSQLNVNYQLTRNGLPEGSAISGNGGAINFGGQSLVGIYRVVASRTGAGGCTRNMAGAVSIVAGALPNLYNVTGGGAFCSGPGLMVGLSGSQNGVRYQLLRNGSNWGSHVNGNGASFNFGLQNQAGTYTVIATNINSGCKRNMANFATISVSVLPFVYNVTGGGTFCSGGTGPVVGLSGSQVNVSYQLLRNGANTGSPRAGTGSPINFGNQSLAGNFTVRAARATIAGCVINMAGSATVISTGTLPLTSISYAGNPFCKTGMALVTRTGQAGGVYSSTAGLVINAATGAINLATSALGTYTVTYSFSNSTCSAKVTTNVTILAIPTATINYAGSPYCRTGTAIVTRTGQAGGVYSSTAGLSINASTGAINLAASTAGVYVVTYTFSNGSCTRTATGRVSIIELPIASIRYAGSPYCKIGSASVIRTGQAGGVYSSRAGLVISPTTGAINLVTSAVGTYIVTYTFSNTACTRTTTASVTINPCSITATKPYTLTKGAKPQMKIEIAAYPNPTATYFNVKVTSTVKETVEVRMFDMLGKMIEIKRGAPDQVLRFGDDVSAGMYIIEARQSGQKEKATIKVIKAN